MVEDQGQCWGQGEVAAIQVLVADNCLPQGPLLCSAGFYHPSGSAFKTSP